jgi:nucleotide-binding universal stress UspA family protein
VGTRTVPRVGRASGDGRTRGVATPTPRRPRRPRPPRTIMLASAGTPIDAAVIDRTLTLAAERPTKVLVLSVARIWGTALGLPNPGLYPTKREWEEQRTIVDDAARALESQGLEVRTKVVGSRSASKAIARWAEFLGCSAIVIGAPALGRADRLLRGDEPNRVAGRTRLRVHTVALSIPDRKPRKDRELPRGGPPGT